ncbi:MAG: D-alanine--D-alanine ligase, partial [Thiotrichales bacterium]|nr:D-alanine--D-alanine ligase [Thiotrichales bacterium]
MGGTATEREVSLKSGKAVLDALVSQGVDAEGIDVVSVEQLLDIAKRYDRVFNVVHGRWGEDGGIQAVLDALDVPYTGSEMAASALTMDKLRTKWLWQGAGLPTPEFVRVSETQPFDAQRFSLP